MKLLFKWVFRGLLLLIFFITIYVVISALLMLFPVNKTENPLTSGSSQNAISVTYGLAHTNILIDLSKSSLKWNSLLPQLVPKQDGYLLIGWGDSATYQSTPNWGDLQASVAVKALFVNTPSALHARYLPNLDRLIDPVIPLRINMLTSHAIENNILNTFRDGIPAILSPGYDAGDRFYHSKGHYNIFNTCNNWTGDILRESGVSMSLWTPFSYNVVYSLSSELQE